MHSQTIIVLATLLIAATLFAAHSGNAAPTTEASKDIYMGVDANDKDAVHQIQKDLSDAKWQELFGDEHKPEDLHFGTDDSHKDGDNKPWFSDKLKDMLGNMMTHVKRHFDAYIENRKKVDALVATSTIASDSAELTTPYAG